MQTKAQDKHDVEPYRIWKRVTCKAKKKKKESNQRNSRSKQRMMKREEKAAT